MTALCCLLMLAVVALVLIGVLNVEVVDQAQTGARSKLSWTVSFLKGGSGVLSEAGSHTVASFVVLTICSAVIAFLSVRFAALTLLFSAVLIVAINLLMPDVQSRPGVFGFMAGLLAVAGTYLICTLLQRRLHHKKVSHLFRNYVPSNLTDYYLKHPKDMQAINESRELTILFCDIKRFTGISETLDSDRLREWLNAYFGVVSDVIDQFGGTVDKYMGDSVMAFWGAPWPSDTHASDALFASKEIQRQVDALSAQMQARGMPEIKVGIGIATGFANVGHMGSRHHMTYTAVGDPVNTANRLQRCTGYYDLSIVVAESTVKNSPEYLFRELDTVHVKGRQRFVRLFEPVCLVDEASTVLLKRLQLHRKAMQFYRRGLWVDAQRIFEKLKQDQPSENDFYQKYVDRIQEIKASRPKDEQAHIVDLTKQVG